MPNIITCPTWGARSPRSPVQTCGQSERIIFHHTAGHHANIANPSYQSYAESVRYAKAIQTFHMNDNGWIDSGHNFLICRNGLILQGRWKTVSTIQKGKMVVSAHCPGQNDQIGIEHEHYGTEEMTREQRESSAWLMAWIAARYKRKTVLPVDPHSLHYATACPANLVDDIPGIRARAQVILDTPLQT